MPPDNVVARIEARVDADVIAEARRAREAAEAAEAESSPSRWREADAYAELSKRGWRVRRIADECGTNRNSVSVMIRMVSQYCDSHIRPSFWAAFGEIHGDKKPVQVSQNSGQEAWYTPPEYIEAARAVLGEIDLHPASSEKAQETVQARQFFTIEGDGLSKRWEGRIWLNPPYNQNLVDKFVLKLCEHFDQGEVTAALLLTNNCTETLWLQRAAKSAAAICLPAGRVHFLNEEGDPVGAPLQGQVLSYFGPEVERFLTTFHDFGFCARIERSTRSAPAQPHAGRDGQTAGILFRDRA
jgi:ParB family chromosome partitioning protein